MKTLKSKEDEVLYYFVNRATNAAAESLNSKSLKPRVQTNENGESLGVTYEPEDGIFKRACNAVVTDDSKDIIKSVVLIIDENSSLMR